MFKESSSTNLFKRLSRRTFLAGFALAVSQRDNFKPKILETTLAESSSDFDTPENATFSDIIMEPIIREAETRRFERRLNDENYLKRINPELNRNRVNFLLYGYGETHEPPTTERAIIGSITIVSVDTQSKAVSLISLTHDIRAPEIERYTGDIGTPYKIDNTYPVGGFALMQETLENASGLSVDFQITFNDEVISSFVDDVFGKISVDSPKSFGVHPFYFEGEKQPPGFFSEGTHELHGRGVIQFIKTVPIDDIDPRIEHNARKHRVFKGIQEEVDSNKSNAFFWMRAFRRIRQDLEDNRIVCDFDVSDLFSKNIFTYAKALAKKTIQNEVEEESFVIKNEIYIVDPAHGAGGVRWVKAEAANGNFRVRRELESGVYEKLRKEFGDPYAFEIPIGGNPYAKEEDLPEEYWKSLRDLVASRLLD